MSKSILDSGKSISSAFFLSQISSGKSKSPIVSKVSSGRIEPGVSTTFLFKSSANTCAVGGCPAGRVRPEDESKRIRGMIISMPEESDNKVTGYLLKRRNVVKTLEISHAAFKHFCFR